MVTERQISGEIKNKRNGNENNGKPRFNEEYTNRGKNVHRTVDCWSKNEEEEDDVNNLFVRATFCGEY